MTNSDHAPSSICDDSICESSLNPNKSSGDIVERLRNPVDAWVDTKPRDDLDLSAFIEWIKGECGTAAAEIERLRREVGEAKAQVAFLIDRIEYSDSYGVPGSDFKCCHLCNGGGAPGVRFEHDSHCPVLRCEPIAAMWWEERDEEWKSLELEAKASENRALTAESAVAAAWEEAAKIAEGPRFAAAAHISVTKGPSWTDETGMAEIVNSHARKIASAIRAAGSKKTAESEHSPSTHNSESE